MVKKRKRKPERKVKKKEFESLIEQRSKEFAEEIEDLGKRFGMHIEHETKKWEKEQDEWWFRTFGLIGPLIGSIFGIVFLAIGIWILNLINLPLGSGFVLEISNFLFTNIHWFFAAFLFFGYSNYLSRRLPKTYWVVSPIISSTGVVFAIWISSWLLNLINIYANSNIITGVSNFLYLNLWGIFVVFLVLGYAIIFIKKMLNIH